MNTEFLDKFNGWMSDNLISYSWDDDDVIIIPDFGRLYVFDSNTPDKIFKSKIIKYKSNGKDKERIELELLLPIPIGELIDDDIFYTIIKWGDNFYYIDLREEVDLKILKYVGKCCLPDDYKYINLGIHTPFELLNGSFMPDMWSQKAKFFGHDAIGICDKNTLAGTLPLQKACTKAGIKHIFGYSLDIVLPAQPKLSHCDFMDKFDCYDDPMAEVNFDQYCCEVGEGIPEKKFGAKIYCLTDDGWANMLRIQKSVMVDNYEDPHIKFDDLISRGSGNCIVFDKFSSTIIDEDIISLANMSFDQVYYQWDMTEFKADRFDELILKAGKVYLDKWHKILKPVLIFDNYYLDASDFRNKSILNKVAHGAAHQQSSEQYYKHLNKYIDDMGPLFSNFIETIGGSKWYDDFLKEITSNTLKIANAATAKIETGVVFMPEYEMKPEEIEKYGDRRNMFLDLLDIGLNKYVSSEKHDIYRERMEQEAYVIESSNNIDYFLILWDIVNFAKEVGIQTGVGRGSAGGSLVSYLLGTTTIDPMDYDLIFERFLTPERCGLEPQDVTILGDECDLDSGDEYMKIEFEDGKSFKIIPESEIMIKRNGKIIEIIAEDLQAGDDIIFDRRDELWELPEIIK